MDEGLRRDGLRAVQCAVGDVGNTSKTIRLRLYREVQMSDAGQNRTPERARPVWEKAFLSSLSRLGNVTDACRAAKIARSVGYEHKDSDDAFKALWQEA